MKKTLLGTTALVAVGLLAGPALASDPLKVTVGGNVVTGFYVVDADNVGGTSFQDTKVAVVARNIDVIAEGTLDNGLTAGVNAKFMLGSDWNSNVQAGSTNFRQLFAYLEGGFGRFEIGGTDGAAYKMHYTSPWFVPGNGVDTPNILNNPVIGTAVSGYGLRQSTFSLLATDDNKVSYFTPRLAGFQLGLSYTPDANTHSPNANGLVVLPGNVAGQVNDVMEVALNYAGSFGGVDLGLDGFYTTGDANVANVDPEEMGLGANIGFAGFTLGGAYYQSEDIVGSFSVAPVGVGADQTVWTAGLSYATGPWTVGVAYLNSEFDNGVSIDSDSWQLGGGYNLGSGVDVGLDLQYQEINPPVGASYEAQSAGIVLAVAF